ncbi:hypothetical protein HMPREF9629_00420 [Peptoanaerobacter stomatis]|uniref:Uncharacterized protein n=1 Tax=Peptoanaerobacter stomatis TaxID=796937 RepID=G9X1Z7_9FIRM|nr:hypothetical protein [Peptoanaerobacter stomatis]EHL13120.1 hypothetical protein HMPREF9629_00420 [Peptoanaerobacter stomatis]
MSVELSILVPIVSVGFAIYAGLSNIKRNQSQDERNSASQMTTVIVKLENISNGITEIKSEMSNAKEEIRENRERIVKVEESSKQAHKRLDMLESQLRGVYEKEN